MSTEAKPPDVTLWLNLGSTMNQVAGPTDVLIVFQHTKGESKNAWQLITTPREVADDMMTMLGILNALQEHCHRKGWSILEINQGTQIKKSSSKPSTPSAAPPLEAEKPIPNPPLTSTPIPTPESPLAVLPPRVLNRSQVIKRSVTMTEEQVKNLPPTLLNKILPVNPVPAPLQPEAVQSTVPPKPILPITPE